MSDDLRELYQEMILDHNKNPKNFRRIEGAQLTADGNNPLCGDQLTVTLNLDGDRIADIAFIGSGCAISKASASMMTVALKGKTLGEARALFEHFHAAVTTPIGVEVTDLEGLGKLAVFSGVREFPVRVKCASLAWHTMQAAIDGARSVSTE